MKSEKNQEVLPHNQHLINISYRLTELNNVCRSFKNKKTLSGEKIFLVKQAIADISKDKEQLQASLKTLLINNGITKPKTLNNQQISDNFLKDLQILYKNYVSLETKKVNNKYSESKKHRENGEGGCCSIF
ncbi:MAG: hypothetical protein IJT14_00600 [Rickettsiales bacterium]|nr:hypothetical protein [Rickettsiales bacterium]